MLNCLVLLNDKLAIRADEVKVIRPGLGQNTLVTMTDGREYVTLLSAREVVDAINIALNLARSAPPYGEPIS